MSDLEHADDLLGNQDYRGYVRFVRPEAEQKIPCAMGHVS